MDQTPGLSHATWITSSYSNGQGGNCVQAATKLPGLVAVRDSKAPAGPVLIMSPAAWRALLSSV